MNAYGFGGIRKTKLDISFDSINSHLNFINNFMLFHEVFLFNLLLFKIVIDFKPKTNAPLVIVVSKTFAHLEFQV